jgi:hypothetical protein
MYVVTFLNKTTELSRAVHEDIANSAAAPFFKINANHGTVRYRASRNTERAIWSKIQTRCAADYLSSKSIHTRTISDKHPSETFFKTAPNE